MIRVVCFYLISHKRLKVGLEAMCAFQIFMLTSYKEAEQPLFEVNFEQLPADKKLGSFATVNEHYCPLNAGPLTASDNFNETNILIVLFTYGTSLIVKLQVMCLPVLRTEVYISWLSIH